MTRTLVIPAQWDETGNMVIVKIARGVLEEAQRTIQEAARHVGIDVQWDIAPYDAAQDGPEGER